MGDVSGAESQSSTPPADVKPRRGPLLTRRNFLRGAAVAAEAALVGGLVLGISKLPPDSGTAESPQARKARLDTPKDITQSDLTPDKLPKVEQEQLLRLKGFLRFVRRDDFKMWPQYYYGRGRFGTTGRETDDYIDVYTMHDNREGRGDGLTVTRYGYQEVPILDPKYKPAEQFDGEVEVTGYLRDSGVVNRVYNKPTTYHLEAKSIQPSPAAVSK